jgi:hypothetical protein
MCKCLLVQALLSLAKPERLPFSATGVVLLPANPTGSSKGADPKEALPIDDDFLPGQRCQLSRGDC